MSTANAKAASCRLLDVSLWCYPTLSRRCLCRFLRRRSVRSRRLCPSGAPCDPREAPLQAANKADLLSGFASLFKVLDKTSRFGFVWPHTTALPLFRLQSDDVVASLGRNVAVGPVQRAEDEKKRGITLLGDCLLQKHTENTAKEVAYRTIWSIN